MHNGNNKLKRQNLNMKSSGKYIGTDVWMSNSCDFY